MMFVTERLTTENAEGPEVWLEYESIRPSATFSCRAKSLFALQQAPKGRQKRILNGDWIRIFPGIYYFSITRCSSTIFLGWFSMPVV
ncbi:MAG: hypothetical protein AABY76_04030, partial [Planctomycetota bacterium]